MGRVGVTNWHGETKVLVSCRTNRSGYRGGGGGRRVSGTWKVRRNRRYGNEYVKGADLTVRERGGGRDGVRIDTTRTRDE